MRLCLRMRGRSSQVCALGLLLGGRAGFETLSCAEFLGFGSALCRGGCVGSSGCHTALLDLVGQLVLKVFGSQDRDFAKQELALDGTRAAVVEHGPHWYLQRTLAFSVNGQRLWGNATNQIFQLPSGLLDHAILSAENDAHPTEVLDFSRTYDERVDAKKARSGQIHPRKSNDSLDALEPSACEYSRDAAQDSGFILDETVENVSCKWLRRRRRGVVEDIRDGLFSAPPRGINAR
jgi:hypothetical protein